MMYKRTGSVLVVALLLTASCAVASRIPPEKKRTAEDELRKFNKHISKRHPEFGETTFASVSWQLFWRKQIDPQQVAISAYVYALIHAYQNCIDYLNQGNGTDVGFSEKYEKLNDITKKLSALPGLPPSIQEHLTHLNEGLWTKVSESTLSQEPKR